MQGSWYGSQALGITAWNGDSLGNRYNAGWSQIVELSSDHSSRKIPAHSWLRVVIQCLQAGPLEIQSVRVLFSECASVVAETK